MLKRALDGESFVVDREHYTLHDMTQIALALKPGAHLTIVHSALMSPIERASIASVGQGRIVFA